MFYCTELQYNSFTFMASTLGISRAPSYKFNQGQGWGEVQPQPEVHCLLWLLESRSSLYGEEEAFSVVQVHE